MSEFIANLFALMFGLSILGLIPLLFNLSIIKANQKYLGNYSFKLIFILSSLFNIVYTFYLLFKVQLVKSSINAKEIQDERIRQLEQRKKEKEENERIEKEEKKRKWQEYLKSPAIQEERKLVFKNLITIPRLTEDSINCLLDQYPTKGLILNSPIEYLSSVPGISENIATAIQARLRNT